MSEPTATAAKPYRVESVRFDNTEELERVRGVFAFAAKTLDDVRRRFDGDWSISLTYDTDNEVRADLSRLGPPGPVRLGEMEVYSVRVGPQGWLLCAKWPPTEAKVHARVMIDASGDSLDAAITELNRAASAVGGALI